MNIEKLLLSYCHPFLVGCTGWGFVEDLEHMSSPTLPAQGTLPSPFPAEACLIPSPVFLI